MIDVSLTNSDAFCAILLQRVFVSVVFSWNQECLFRRRINSDVKFLLKISDLCQKMRNVSVVFFSQISWFNVCDGVRWL